MDTHTLQLLLLTACGLVAALCVIGAAMLLVGAWVDRAFPLPDSDAVLARDGAEAQHAGAADDALLDLRARIARRDDWEHQARALRRLR